MNTKPHEWKQPNPDYQRTPPTETTVNGVLCVNVDGSGMVEAARMAEAGMKRKQGDLKVAPALR